MERGVRTPGSGLAWLCGIGFSVLLSLGCGLTAKQKLVLANFSQSTATVGDATSIEMNLFHDEGIKANTQVLLLAGQPKQADLPHLDTLDRGYELKTIKTIAGAANALAAYGKTLSALTNDTQTADLKKASSDFIQSLAGIPEVSAAVTNNQLNAVGEVIQDVCGIWIEHKRKVAVLMLVDQYSPAIDKLCDRLIADFSSDKDSPGMIYQQCVSGKRA
jgi:hypothetical protein